VSEAELADARNGGEHGLTALFRAFHPRLLRYLRARQPARADDIASDTWVAVASQIGTFEGDLGAFSAWIFTIARLRLADELRTAARRQTNPVDDIPLEPTSDFSERVVERASAQEAVDFIARNLTADQAEVVLLRTLGDLDAAQVATIMGHDATWVRVTHHRALQRLRERMVDKNL
jgi:RNA polymerase sigma-70 factor (ECF subfamily)